MLASSLLACEVDLDTVSVDCPPADPVNFRRVSEMLEFRCGTLDCHGNTFRPLRIYGRNGLRRPENLTIDGSLPEDSGLDAATQYPNYHTGGSVETTTTEMMENARSLCGLEPERIAEFRERVVKEPDNAANLAGELLTIVRKPRLQERHKGGLIWTINDSSDKCLISWLIPVEEGATVPQGECKSGNF
ncbi:hypothetical protein [Chondromyces apiculatus]|uniref:Uncharacterized protein n=1 Tax=Chondromyces apiculatus DSM 436 TaxID=1192034 RepID=A0A017T6A6_9BACT|nr:hypothetical protein [Chondromyces apiculatus]EYF04335.1 Hypothetical protein CAP_4599 [Chondromyces apiculatus DSM 436]